jgi:single-strand DNA-binding protein
LARWEEIVFNNNRITADVRLGKDVELEFTQSGKAVASTSAAMDIGKRDDGLDPIWLRIKGWEYTAEVMAQLKKGDAVRVDGYLTEERWKKDGEDHSALVVVCDSVTKRLFKPRIPENAGQSYKAPRTSQYGNPPRVPPITNQDDSDDIPF